MSVIYRRDLAISSLAFWSRSLALIVHHVRYIKILTRLRGFLVISLYLVWFGLVFFVLKSLLAIAKQRSLEKFDPKGDVT